MPETPAPTERGKLTFVRGPISGLDRLLPARTGPFLAVILGLGAAFWLTGWALAAERGRLVASREWMVQPLYLAVHLGLLRLFVSAYATNFAAGCAALDVDPSETTRRLRTVLGVRSIVAACLVAIPFVIVDVQYLGEEEYVAHEVLGSGGVLGAADWLMVGCWTVEWVVNAYVWVLIVSFLWETMHVLRHHRFRDPVERVLRERQFRPFLLMSSEGASLTLVFALANAGYVWVARGAASDYIGLWVTGGLILLAFVPPWLTLKSRIGSLVDAEANRLGDSLERGTAAIEAEGLPPERSLEEIGARVDLTLAILRAERLRRLQEELGKSEAQAVLLRLLAPALTGAWRFFKPF